MRSRTRFGFLAALPALIVIAGCGRSIETGPEPNMTAVYKIRDALASEAAGGVKTGASPAAAANVKWCPEVTGRFLFEGSAPSPAKLTIDKDKDVCGDNLFAEDLVVSPAGELANVVIYIAGKTPVHPDLAKSADTSVTLDNHGCHFVPHVVGIQVGQTLHLINSDPLGHNTNIVGTKLKFNQSVQSGGFIDLKVDDPENLPALVNCSIHPWMKARLVIRSNPYFAISGKDGRFTIKNVPAGDLEFQVYHERSGYVEQAVLQGKESRWEKGRFKYPITADKPVDLGDIKLAAEQFNK